jgi:hypothetical protein
MDDKMPVMGRAKTLRYSNFAGIIAHCMCMGPEPFLILTSSYPLAIARAALERLLWAICPFLWTLFMITIKTLFVTLFVMTSAIDAARHASKHNALRAATQHATHRQLSGPLTLLVYRLMCSYLRPNQPNPQNPRHVKRKFAATTATVKYRISKLPSNLSQHTA